MGDLRIGRLGGLRESRAAQHADGGHRRAQSKYHGRLLWPEAGTALGVAVEHPLDGRRAKRFPEISRQVCAAAQWLRSGAGREKSRRRYGLALHRDLGLQAGEIAVDRRDRQHAAVAAVSQQAILRLDVALDRDLVPLLGVAHAIYRHVVMLAPEERHRFESLA